MFLKILISHISFVSFEDPNFSMHFSFFTSFKRDNARPHIAFPRP